MERHVVGSGRLNTANERLEFRNLRQRDRVEGMGRPSQIHLTSWGVAYMLQPRDDLCRSH